MVCVLRNTRFATCRLLSPCATRPATRRSVSVRLSQPKAGRSVWAQWCSRVPAARRLDRTRARSSASPSCFVQGVGLAEQGGGPVLIAVPGPGVPGVFQRAGPGSRGGVAPGGPLQGGGVLFGQPAGVVGGGRHIGVAGHDRGQLLRLAGQRARPVPVAVGERAAYQQHGAFGISHPAAEQRQLQVFFEVLDVGVDVGVGSHQASSCPPAVLLVPRGLCRQLRRGPGPGTSSWPGNSITLAGQPGRRGYDWRSACRVRHALVATCRLNWTSGRPRSWPDTWRMRWRRYFSVLRCTDSALAEAS